MVKYKVNVTHEWGRLKKTLLGIPTDIYFYKAISDLKNEFVTKKTKEKLQSWNDSRLFDKSSAFFEKLCSQMKALANFLRNYEEDCLVIKK